MLKKTLILFIISTLPAFFILSKSHSSIKPTRFVIKKPTFDIPVTYNKKVRYWINVFQTRGKKWLAEHMALSHRFRPQLEKILEKKGLPKDLSYIAMIESGFSSQAISSAKAVGVWQFMKRTANSYGLKTNWWIDERKDIKKSTKAASNYLSDLYKKFDSWYLTAAAYNMGETKLRYFMKKYKTRNFWILSRKSDFPKETKNYIPKLIAVMIIAKSPNLYGFKNVKASPLKHIEVKAPGGLDLVALAQDIGLKQDDVTKINPELILGFIPKNIKEYTIKIPKRKLNLTNQYIKTHF